MKCLNKRILSLLLVGVFFSLTLTGCQSSDIDIPYGMLNNNDDYSITSKSNSHYVPMFAEDLCATDVDVVDTSTIDMNSVLGAGIYDVNSKQVLYSYNATRRLNPASITKIMTALVVIESGVNLSDVVTVPNCSINESGAQLFNIKEGDKITIENLLYATLVYSGNDSALALANIVGGSEEGFADLMNEKARQLGCTGTHFVNSNGLTAEEHYTTVYDLYLIFNEALKYDLIKNIINTSSVDISYTNSNGEYITKTINSTDKFLTGDYSMPGNATIIGGKTGSTNAAGKCLMVCAEDPAGNPYICVILGAADEQALYNTMRQLCEETIGH